jgi:hypothetical protein
MMRWISNVALLCSALTLLVRVPTITDSTHGVVPAVRVLVTETNTNFSRSELSNDSGFYAFANLDPGDYRVEVEHPGFRKTVRSDLRLEANSTLRVDLELTPGDIKQVVLVQAETLLQTDRADTGSKIQTQQLATLPLLNNRNYHAGARCAANLPFEFTVLQLPGTSPVCRKWSRPEEQLHD